MIRVTYEQWRRVTRRSPRWSLTTSRRVARAACTPRKHAGAVAHRGERELAAAGISIHRDVIGYPLARDPSPATMGERFLGGLADPATGGALVEADHYNGVGGALSLPPAYVAGFSGTPTRRVERPVLYAGILYDHFGHFLAESLARLYAYETVRELDPYLLFLTPWGVPRYFERDNFVGQTLRGFDIPLDRVLVLDRPMSVDELYVPAQEYGFGYLHRPAAAFVDFVRRFHWRPQTPVDCADASHVYVARLPASGRGAQIGERAFADALALDGYAVFRPERHSLVEQLTVYSRAEHVVFAEGSAVLGCVLLPDLAAEVAVVARRRDPVRDVRTATDCFRGYGKDVLWIDAVGRQFSFGLESWDALAEIDWSFVSRALSDAGFVTPAFAVECSDAQVRNELRAFVRELLDEPRALDFFGACGETHDAWSGPSHVRDPRTGRAV